MRGSRPESWHLEIHDFIGYNNRVMKTISKNNLNWSYFFAIAINTFFGWQILKAFLSLLVNFYRERPNIVLTDVAIFAVISFSLVFATGFLFDSVCLATSDFLASGFTIFLGHGVYLLFLILVIWALFWSICLFLRWIIKLIL